jgi:hypothetical protein
MVIHHPQVLLGTVPLDPLVELVSAMVPLSPTTVILTV